MQFKYTYLCFFRKLNKKIIDYVIGATVRQLYQTKINRSQIQATASSACQTQSGSSASSHQPHTRTAISLLNVNDAYMAVIDE